MADLKQTTFKIALKTRHKLYINQMVILILIIKLYFPSYYSFITRKKHICILINNKLNK